MLAERILAILSLMKALDANGQTQPWLNTAGFQDERRGKHKEAEISSRDELLENNNAFSSKENLTTKQTTSNFNLPKDQKAVSSSPLNDENGGKGREKRCRCKLSNELNKKQPGRDILAQLDYDIEEQDMDKRSRIELLSYMDAALKNKNIELNMELRHLAKAQEDNLNDKVQVENVNHAAAIVANIEQLNKRIKDLDDRSLRMKKIKEQKLLEKIPEVKTLTLMNRPNYMTAHWPPSEPSEQQTSVSLLSNKVDGKALTKYDANKVDLLKDAPSGNFGYVPYQIPMPYSDPLQILRLTNPDFAGLAQPVPWLNSGWAGYAPNYFQYPVERQYPQSLYTNLARHQALPVPLRKV